ncbi:MAG: hypothetical protein QXE31_03675 [Candidatus Woesearchaeota archaeon]
MANNYICKKLCKMRYKKAQFFIIDGIFGIIILIMGYLLLFSSYRAESNAITMDNIADNFYDLITNVKGEDLCNAGNCNFNNLTAIHNNVNINQTLITIIGELYNKNNRAQIKLLIKDFIDTYNLVDDRYGLKIRINNEEIFSKGDKFQKAEQIINRQTIVFGYYENPNDGSFIKFGPYLVEVLFWNEK